MLKSKILAKNVYRIIFFQLYEILPISTLASHHASVLRPDQSSLNQKIESMIAQNSVKFSGEAFFSPRIPKIALRNAQNE